MMDPRANSDVSAVQRTLERFLEAFDRLDWEHFREYFSDEATVFFPFDDNPHRADGRSEVEAIFKAFFENVRKQAPGPPYLHLNPKELNIQLLDDVAIVTFHLYVRNFNGLGRRSFVLQKQNGNWKIIHLHASHISQQK